MSKIVVFLDTLCGPSQQMLKALREVKKEFEIEIVNVNGDPSRVQAEGVRAVPTIQVFDNNDKVIKTFVGYNVNLINRIRGVLNGADQAV